jgi:hypothetical protein
MAINRPFNQSTNKSSTEEEMLGEERIPRLPSTPRRSFIVAATDVG